MPPKKASGTAPLTPTPRTLELKVYSKGADEDGMETLIGDYAEVGINHTRKYFKKKIPSDDGDVFLYFWDARDGADQSGWWFGDSVGGTQVWARSQNNGALPPSSGWRVPWDGAVNNNLCVLDKSRSTPTPKASATPKASVRPAMSAGEEPVAAAANGASAEERVQKVSSRISAVEAEAVQALGSAKALMDGDDSDGGLASVEEMLQAQQAALTEATKMLTTETVEVRRLDPKVVPEMTKLQNKVRGVSMQVNQQLANTKKIAAQKKKEAEDSKRRAMDEERTMQAEQRDAKLLEEALPLAMDLVTQAEDALDNVLAAAAPLENGLEEDMVDEANVAIKETDAAFSKAQVAVTAARKELSARMAAVQKFAPEAKKVAVAEYSAMQDKMNEVFTKLNQYKNVKKDWEQKHESKRVMAEVTSKLGEAEAELEKLLKTLPEGAKPSDDEIKSSESMVSPVLNSLLGAIKFIDTKAAAATGALKQDLTQMRERGGESKKKLEAFKISLRTAGDKQQLDSLVAQCEEKLKAAEEALAQMDSSEEPFIKGGVDGMDEKEATDALQECEESAKKADMVSNSAKAFLKTKSIEIKRFPETSRKVTMDEMTKLQTRVDAVSQKIVDFRKETTGRKTTIILRELVAKAIDSEAKLQAVVEAAKPLHADNLEEMSIEALREATEKTLELEKVVAGVCAEGRKLFAAKQKESPGKDATTYTAELQKLNTRLNTVQQDLAKERKAALNGEKIYKVRQTVQEKQKEMDDIEAELEKVEIMTTPIGDERPSNEAIQEMDSAVTGVQATLTECKKACDSATQSAQGPHKEALQKLLERCKEAQAKLDEIKETTREQIERVTCEKILDEAQKRSDKIEEAFEKADQAEAPFLKGLDLLPLEEATQGVADSEAAIAVVQQLITEARTFFSSKNLELRKLLDAISKPGLAKIAELTSKNDEATKRLAEFKKETEGRKRAAQLQEGLAKVDAADEAVKKTTEAAAPLSGEEEVSAEVAQEICEKLGEIESAAHEKVDEARKFLMSRQKEAKTAEDRAEISKLLTRVNSIQVDLAKARTAANQVEQRMVGKLLMAEASDIMQALEGKLDEVVEAASPLTEEGGRDFIVASMTKLLLNALMEYANQNAVSKEDLFKQMTKGEADKKATEENFIAFFGKIPDMCSRPDLAFSEDQLGAIFELVDEDADGSLSQVDFVDMFRERFICVGSVSLTDAFDVQSDDCKAVAKLEVGDVLEALGEPETHESLGVSRMQVKSLKDSAIGYITMQGNQGTTYVEPFTAYAAFMRGLEKVIAETQAHSTKASSFVSSKSAELKDCTQGPLVEVKENLMKMRPKISVLQAKLDQLKKRIEESGKEHAKREEMERKKAAEKKDRKAAAVILKALGEKVEQAQASWEKFALAASTIYSIEKPPDLDVVNDPVSVQTNAKTLLGSIEAMVVAAKEAFKAQEQRLANVTKGPWFEAKQDISKLQQEISDLESKVAKVIAGMQTACEEIGKAKLLQVSTIVRTTLQAQSKTIESLYIELAGEAAEYLPEEIFKNLECVTKLGLSPEPWQLLLKQLGATANGISRRSFFQMLERYCKCVKDIAITSEFDIGAGDVIRKLEIGEFVEVLEGPRIDTSDESQVPRIRAKAVTDGANGWITVKGNQGTAFLEDTTKPCLYATESVPLQDGFASEGTNELRHLTSFEVVEVLEGPRKEIVGSASRAKGKASDGTVGFFTVKSKQGTELAVPGKSSWTTTSAIALTDNFDIKACKVVRKLAKGEVLTVMEGPVEDGPSGVSRIKIVAKKDGKEGWVTTRGNAGTKYAEETGKTYNIVKATPMQSSFSSDSETVRMLAAEESIELLEDAREEQGEPPIRIRVRCVSDGVLAWATLKGSNLKPWRPHYRCVKGTGIGDAFEVSNAEPVRPLEVGETISVIDGPRLDVEVGVARLKCRADSDGVVGWVTLAGNQGTQFLEVVSA